MKTAALPARLATAAVLTATLCIFPSCSEKPVAKPLENTSPAAAPASQLVTAAPAQPEMPLQTAIAPQAISVSPPTQAAAKPQPPAPPPEPPIDIKSEEVTTLLATIKEKGAVLATWKEGDPIDEETAKAL